MHCSRPVLILVLLPALLVACGHSTHHRVERFEIDGIPLVRTIGGPKYDAPILELESDLVLGIDEGEPEWQIFTIAPHLLLVTEDGRMVLVDDRNCEILILSREGHLITKTGKRGSGPGEFQSIRDLVWAEMGIEFWAVDASLQRITRFSMEGKLLGSFDYSQQRNDWAGNFYSLGNHRFLGIKSGRYDIDIPMRFAFLDDGLRFTQAFVEVPSHVTWQATSGGTFPVPFTSTAGVEVFPDGRLLSYHPYEGRLTIYTTTGMPVLHIERDWEYPPVTSEDRERTLRRFRESRSQPMRELASQVPFPERRGAFSGVILDDQGRIWVTRSKPIYEGDQVVAYVRDIFDPDCVWIGSHASGTSPLQIAGGFLYHSFEADSGGPRFERLRIVPLVSEMESGRIQP